MLKWKGASRPSSPRRSGCALVVGYTRGPPDATPSVPELPESGESSIGVVTSAAMSGPTTKLGRIAVRLSALRADVALQSHGSDFAAGALKASFNSRGEYHSACSLNAPPLVFVNRPGKGGKPHWKPLTERGIAAFKLFIEEEAFGDFSQSSIYKSWKLACEDAHVPFFNPYRLRHTYATTLRAEGLDLADVQELVGHSPAGAPV
jgi:integrase